MSVTREPTGRAGRPHAGSGTPPGRLSVSLLHFHNKEEKQIINPHDARSSSFPLAPPVPVTLSPALTRALFPARLELRFLACLRPAGPARAGGSAQGQPIPRTRTAMLSGRNEVGGRVWKRNWLRTRRGQARQRRRAAGRAMGLRTGQGSRLWGLSPAWAPGRPAIGEGATARGRPVPTGGGSPSLTTPRASSFPLHRRKRSTDARHRPK